ncbi:DRE BINDING PROTEIN 1B, C-repeat/DRE binding factor 1 [Hibiscus trionum]|uniref:DRE BINDING PROTEIN 1B, C-repeat/DRE binding factor 1 n=1 Tax=Hibiscus trionum TaxID=183268 RepID=A0A9W7LXQ8_HIBTR|nr:DRE BINDING PROTEIN 1B, C-repeat/DRE binding factor 1 [Hibiscus trionum]
MEQREDQQQVLSSETLQISCSSLGQVEAQSHKRKAGRKIFKETQHPIFKGVRRRKGKWVSEVRDPNKKSRIWLGTFSSPGKASKAYDAAALALKGDSASLNFPESAHTLPRARSSSVRDIQIAAMEAAEAFIEDGDANTTENAEGSSSTSKTLYIDEEEVFNMPGILKSMAEGLMITPPSWGQDDANNYEEFTLWGD